MLYVFLCAYLRAALFLGRHRHVYRLAQKWATSGAPRDGREAAAWYIRAYLLRRGYHQCPSCYWATEEPDEHVKVIGSYCWEDQQPECRTCHARLDGATECPYCAEAAEQRAAFERDEARRRKEEDDLRQQEWAEEEQEALNRQRERWQDERDRAMGMDPWS